jgi:hypothetical protein
MQSDWGGIINSSQTIGYLCPIIMNCVTRRKTASTNDGLPEILKMKYRIPEPGTTISSFADSKKKNADPRFF